MREGAVSWWMDDRRQWAGGVDGMRMRSRWDNETRRPYPSRNRAPCQVSYGGA